MKVLMIVPSFPKLSETFIVSKFIGLYDKGVDVHIFCNSSFSREWLYFPSLMANSDFRKRVHISWPTEPKVVPALLFIPALISCLILRPFTTLQYLILGYKEQGGNVFKQFYLDREIIIINPDILHYEFGALAVGKEYLKKRLKCLLIASFRGHDLYFVGLDAKNYYNRLWEIVDAVHFLGGALKKKAMARGFKESILSIIINPAIDVNKFTAQDKLNTSQEKKIRLLTVGRLHWAKGYEYALQACKALADQGVQFEYHIAGGGDGLASLAYCTHQLSISESVTFLGSISPEKVYEEYKWADIYLHPAVEEGFGNSVIEAQAMQLPVVCSDAVGLPENVENGITGFVVPRRNSGALVEKLITLANSPELRRKMGRAGQERAVNLYQINEQIEQFKDFYQRVSEQS